MDEHSLWALLSGTVQGTMLVTPAVYVLEPRYLRRTNENPLGAY